MPIIDLFAEVIFILSVIMKGETTESTFLFNISKQVLLLEKYSGLLFLIIFSIAVLKAAGQAPFMWHGCSSGGGERSLLVVRSWLLLATHQSVLEQKH